MDIKRNPENLLFFETFKELGVDKIQDIDPGDLLEYLRDMLQTAGEDLTDPTKERESGEICVGIGAKNAAMYIQLAILAIQNRWAK